MNIRTTTTRRHLRLAAAATGLVAASSLATWLLIRPAAPVPTARPSAPSGEATMAMAPDAPAAAGSAGAGMQASADAVVIELTDDAVRRAGIRTAEVGGDALPDATISVPGAIEPDAYRTVVVTPLVSGRVTAVSAALGDRVRRGTTLARVFSPELAAAQTRYVSDRAALEAHEQEVNRTASLVKIGAASREELERVHAAHAAHRAAVALAASRLELLGWSPAAIDALRPDSRVESSVDVPAPIDGVVTARGANVGLNVDMATPLFTVVDLTRVWAIGEVYERDLSHVRIGSPAEITAAAFPGLSLAARVAYIDPALRAETRTARVRVEVPNPDGALRLGMLATIRIAAPAAAGTMAVPARAIQLVGDRTVVYVSDPARPGTFVERAVRVGPVVDGLLPVLEGLSSGERVVTDGSFLLRAERERLGAAAAAPTPAPRAESPAGIRRPARPDEPGRAATQEVPAMQEERVVVSEQGFEPARVALPAGVPARLTFVRTTDATCGTEVVIPALNERRSLPLNEPVVIELPPRVAGDITFTCGMDMLRGTIVVR